ncbi:MAG: VWA domain-containing protein [Chitinophagaceae bacterium]|nr:VWA domain-containing protein [Chitinophagaceae bacterium]
MKLFFSGCAAIALLTAFSFSNPKPSTSKPAQRKIQVAILLDVSNSMDGLIEQAKAQLWDMVITLGKAQCDDKTIPNVEVALYEYGRPANGADKGFVKQLSPFTNDLDSVSKLLFGLVTNGGDEYCGQVIFNSIDELKWDSSPDNYKVVFIAGNEDFLQGSLHYTKSCDKAKNKGVIVNTIYCGSYEQGIREHWNLLGECGNGSYTNINKDAKEIIIPTPYDSTLIVLNGKLNTTYVGFGALASGGMAKQAAADQMNFDAGSEMQAKRIAAKAQSNAYWNGTWDMIDAYNADSSNYFKKLDKKTLPDSLKNRSTQELKTLVWEKTKERTEVQNQINTISVQRNKYIEQKKAEMRTASNEPTLESAVNKILREQVKRCNMVIQ